MASSSRVVIAASTGIITFVSVLLLSVAAGLPITAGLSVVALTGAALLAVWVGRGAASLRFAWGRGCLVNGLLSAAVAVSFRVQDDLWAGRQHSAEDLERAIGPLTHFVWELAARIGLVALILATVLVALSYWLLGPPHRQA